MNGQSAAARAENAAKPIALVTGAARGIGLSTSVGLLDAGHRVVMVDLEQIDLRQVGLARHQESLLTFVADVRSLASFQEIREIVLKRWGPLKVLVNNAGISVKNPLGRASTLETTSDAEWEAVLEVNLTAVMRLCRMFLPDMRAAGIGRIVNVSSLAGRTRSRVAGPAYVTTKTALIGLTRAIAGEYGQFGITANCVAPGRIISAMSGPAESPINQDYLSQIPCARFGTTDEVAAAVCYLASDIAGFINGAVIDINGGAHMP